LILAKRPRSDGPLGPPDLVWLPSLVSYGCSNTVGRTHHAPGTQSVDRKGIRVESATKPTQPFGTRKLVETTGSSPLSLRIAAFCPVHRGIGTRNRGYIGAKSYLDVLEANDDVWVSRQ